MLCGKFVASRPALLQLTTQTNPWQSKHVTVTASTQTNKKSLKNLMAVADTEGPEDLEEPGAVATIDNTEEQEDPKETMAEGPEDANVKDTVATDPEAEALIEPFTLLPTS